MSRAGRAVIPRVLSVDTYFTARFDSLPMFTRSIARLSSLATLGATFALAACSAGAGDGESSSQGGAGSGASGPGSTSTFGEGGSTGTFGEGGSTSGQGGGCAGLSQTAQKVPLDMYIMLDKSGSMTDPANGGGTRWDAVTSALLSFVAEPDSAGIGVGIEYFPQPSGVVCPTFPTQCTSDAQCQTGCGPCTIMPGFPFGICEGVGVVDSCVVGDYASPSVGIGELPGNQGAITASINGEDPDGSSTTTAPALEGAIQHAKEWAIAHPGHVVVVVLATDGDPNKCGDDLNAINAIAAAGFSGTPSIKTFVIGVGGSQGALNGFAAAGGTMSAFLVDQGPNVQQAFLDALNVIQGQSLPCSYLLPAPPQGETLDFGAVNVVYTPGGGGAEQTIPKAGDPGNCPPGGLAWYYDDPAAPTQIVLCPDTCGTLSSDMGGKVDIVVGCATVVQ